MKTNVALNKPKSHKIKPYARLLTMLGEQLIKNERIALVELIKNSYDADSKWVKISYIGFGEGYKVLPGSKIVIEDAGCGMNLNLIVNHWLNPATPEKKLRKSKKDKTKSGRIIQGEKGIGRFAILKLGRKINVITKTADDEYENVIEYDFTMYDDDFLTKNGEAEELFLEDINVSVKSRVPEILIKQPMLLSNRKITRPSQGTRIEIEHLKGSWSDKKVEDVYRDISRLQSIFVENINKNASEFEVLIYKDDLIQNFHERYYESLHVLLNEKAVLRVEDGHFNQSDMSFKFSLNNKPVEIDLLDPLITGLKTFRDRFGKAGEFLKNRSIECGSFKFGFYVFDFSPKASVKYHLSSGDKKILKDHRIYLYRDGIRVYPYGEPDDDWLKIDVFRGTISAGQFLSNDQVVGYVNISQKGNPKLKDKTNREGLIDEGDATQDFVALIQCVLFYLRHGPYKRYQIDNESKNSHDIFKTEQVQENFNELKLATVDNKKAQELIVKAEREYKAERSYLVQRAETTEELAGVGLSVETASHDIMGIMAKVFANLDGLIHDLMRTDDIDKDALLRDLQSVRGGLSFIEAQLRDIQLLFKSSKQRRKDMRVKETVEKVERIYARLLKKEKIKLTINTIGYPLVAKATDAVLLQLLLNLFDNSVYWLTQISIPDREIIITLNGSKGQMTFADNGPGINKEDAPYIFEPFYSGKGEDGRGLGLYIARQLLERLDYNIELAQLKSDKVLSGANFIISFFSEEE